MELVRTRSVDLSLGIIKLIFGITSNITIYLNSCSCWQITGAVRPIKILCFGQPDPTYRNQLTLDFFLQKYHVFFRWGLYNLGFNS